MGKNYIQKNSKEIAESFLSTRSKAETAKAFSISPHGVERALYYQGLGEYIAPSSLDHIKSKVERPVRVAEVPKSRPSLLGKQPSERGKGEFLMSLVKTHSKEITESFLSNRSKKKTAKAFGISEYGVDSALYYQGLEEYVAPSVLTIKKREAESAGSEEGLKLGQLITRRRNELGLTTQQLGEKCGVRAQQIGRIERGVRSPSTDLLESLTRELKLDLGKFADILQRDKGAYKLTGKQVTERGLELANARKWAYEYWETNPDATPTLTQEALKAATGEFVAVSTIGGWHLRLETGRLPQEPIQPMPQKPSPGLTWEDIVRTAPDRLELASLLFDGFIKVLADQRQRIDELLKERDTLNKTIATLSEQVAAITKDRKKIMQEYDELLAKIRSGGHFTLDQTRQILGPKR